ncbi:MAG: hypothetical protein AAFY28_15080 [Actinomycetota bacterium]
MRAVRGALFGAVMVLLLAPLAATSTTAQGELAGSQGIDTALPTTDSAATYDGRGDFAELSVTVNQTRNLTNQAVSVTWSGGTKTRRGPGQYAAHFVQIMQCWGDPDGSVPENPGPPPEQCVFGASTARFGGIGEGIVPAGNSTRRVISNSRWDNFDPQVGYLEEQTNKVWREFWPVNGPIVQSHINPDYNPQRGGTYWTNPDFNIVTTNEISAAVTTSDGTGAELFQVLTGVESTGLGCGQRVQQVDGADSKIPQCWIVVVPRGEPVTENINTPSGGPRADVFGVSTSPLSPEAWANRIAIPIEFNPVDSPCSISDVERRIAGNDLVLQAVARWQPALCEGGNLPPYSYAPVADSTARGLLTNPTAGSPGMVVVSRPIPTEQIPDDAAVVYSPLSVSGLTIGFNVERLFTLDAPPDAQDRLTGLRVADINLTPRLVAKLLTQSYGDAVAINGSDPGYDWLPGQPAQLAVDPDFVQFNPEFSILRIGDRRTFSGLQLPAGNSDAARQVWEWILADPEASAWLDGQPDEWGMRVNPVYSTNTEINPAGIDFSDPAPASFPKGDPYCYQETTANDIVPPLLCGTDWMPYARNFSETATRARRGFDGAKIARNIFALRSTDYWQRGEPQFIGRRAMISLTDTPNAALLGLQVASLSRAGDNGADREFVSPDADGLSRGLDSMEPLSGVSFLEPVPSDQPAGAYPLTTITYAAINPLALDDQAREEYASFIEYAVGPGQEAGFRPGELPQGFEPLPLELRFQSLIGAELVRTIQALPPPPSTAPASTTAPPTTALPIDPATLGSTTTEQTATTPTPAFPTSPPVEPSFGGGANSSSGSGSTSSSGSSASNSTSATTTATTTTTEPDTEPADEAAAPTSEGDVAVEQPVPVEREPIATPATATSIGRLAVPVLGSLALFSALLVLEITKRPRRLDQLGDDELDADNPFDHPPQETT